MYVFVTVFRVQAWRLFESMGNISVLLSCHYLVSLGHYVLGSPSNQYQLHLEWKPITVRVEGSCGGHLTQEELLIKKVLCIELN